MCRRDYFITERPLGRANGAEPWAGVSTGERAKRADEGRRYGIKAEGPAEEKIRTGNGGRVKETEEHLDGRQRQQTGYYQDDRTLPLWYIFIILLWAVSGPGVDVRRRVCV